MDTNLENFNELFHSLGFRVEIEYLEEFEGTPLNSKIKIRDEIYTLSKIEKHSTYRHDKLEDLWIFFKNEDDVLFWSDRIWSVNEGFFKREKSYSIWNY